MSGPAFTRAVILQRVAQVLKAAQVHALTNQLLRTGVQQLHEVVRSLEGEQPLTILWASDAMFVNRALITQGPGVAHTIEAFKKLFERLKVHELSFDPHVTEEQLFDFLGVFQKHWHSQTPEAVVHEPGPIRFRALGKEEIGALGVGTIDKRQNVLRNYARLAMLTKVVVDHVTARQPFKLGLLRRAVQQLAEASTGADALLAGLTRFPNLQGELHFHLVATSALTLLMGRRLELPRGPLVDLAEAALLHDLARLDLARAGADIEARRHTSLQLPARSMLAVTSLAFTRDAMLSASCAFESGLPANAGDPLFRPGAAARLIAVPSFYSRLTTPQPPRKAFAPDQALHMLRRRAGGAFDADVVSLFIATVGLYPVGSTVRLSSGELAVVLEVPKDPANGARPVVKVFRNAAGAPLDAVVDLATDPTRRAVVEAVELVEAANPMPFLLA